MLSRPRVQLYVDADVPVVKVVGWAQINPSENETKKQENVDRRSCKRYDREITFLCGGSFFDCSIERLESQ